MRVTGSIVIAACLAVTAAGLPSRGRTDENASAGASVSSARNIDDYKREVAKRIYSASKDQVFDGAAPPLLKAVIVLSISVDSKGMAQPSIMRSNGFTELEDLAMQSVK